MNIEDMNDDEFYFYELEMNLSIAEENIIYGQKTLNKLYGLKKVMKEVISITNEERKRIFGHIGSPNLEKEYTEYAKLREKIEEWNQKTVKYQIYVFSWTN